MGNLCIHCLEELCGLDDDLNGDRNVVCARCRAEENHDFDAEPDAVFDRAGQRIEETWNSYYLVYLPLLRVMFVSSVKSECVDEYNRIGRDYDEDYKVMSDKEFIDMVRECLNVRIQ